MASVGKIRKWNDEKGYGFVHQPGERDTFVHIKDFPFYQRRPRVGDRVRFDRRIDEQRGPRAVLPRLLGVTSSWGAIVLGLLWTSSLLVGALVFVGTLPLNVTTLTVGSYVIGGALTFSAYLLDKQRAVTHCRRVPEATLHFLELAGGWPAAFIAQQLFRHKNRKVSYQAIFWLIFVIHVAFWTRSTWLPLLGRG